MRRLLIAGMVTGLLAAPVAAEARPWLPQAEAKRYVERLARNKPLLDSAAYWDVGGCYRLSRTAVRCRAAWAEEDNEQGSGFVCRATYSIRVRPRHPSQYEWRVVWTDC